MLWPSRFSRDAPGYGYSSTLRIWVILSKCCAFSRKHKPEITKMCLQTWWPGGSSKSLPMIKKLFWYPSRGAAFITPQPKHQHSCPQLFQASKQEGNVWHFFLSNCIRCSLLCRIADSGAHVYRTRSGISEVASSTKDSQRRSSELGERLSFLVQYSQGFLSATWSATWPAFRGIPRWFMIYVGARSVEGGCVGGWVWCGVWWVGCRVWRVCSA